MRLIRILWQFWKAAFIQAMEYRTSFFIGILANACDFSFGLIQYILFFSAAKSIAGWDNDQMLTLYGEFMTVFSLHFMFLYPNLEAMSRMVNRGELDLALTKPVSAQIVLSFRNLSFDEFGSFFAAQVLLGYLVFSGALTVTIPGLLLFFVAMLFSLSFVYALFLCLMALAIAMEKLQNSAELLWSLFSLSRYPVDVYPRWLRTLFMAVIPIGFISTVPARILTRGEDPLVLLLGFALIPMFMVLARWAWVKALKGYCSAGG